MTPPSIEVLDGRTLGPSDVLGRTHYPLIVLCNQWCSCITFEDLRTHAKSFQSPEWESAFSCPLHDCLGVFGP